MNERIHNLGFTMVELMISIALASVLCVYGYNAAIHSTRQADYSVRDTKKNLEANKALDQLHTRIQNVVGITNSDSTVLGSLPPHSLTCPMVTANSTSVGSIKPSSPWPAPDACEAQNWARYGNDCAGSFIIPGGIVPLPGLTKSKVDPALGLTYVSPSKISPSADPNSDAFRLAYIPTGSTPVKVKTTTLPASAIPADPTYGTPMIPSYIELDLPDGATVRDFFKVGDFGMISEGGKRELFRITDISGIRILHEWEKSIWNKIFKSSFTPNAAVQKVEIATYAHDPIEKILYVDSHQKDDRFSESTGAFSMPPTRVKNWEPVATHVSQFKIYYKHRYRLPDASEPSGFEIEPSGVRETENPVAGNAGAFDENVPDECTNQVGFPAFQMVRVEIKMESGKQDEDKNHNAKLVRQGGSDMLRSSGDLYGPTYENTPITLVATPVGSYVPPPGPTATPVPVGGYSGGF